LFHDAFVNQAFDITQSGVGGRFCDFRPLRRVKFSIESIEQFIQDNSLAFVDGCMLVPHPKLGFSKNVLRVRFDGLHRPFETMQEPVEPFGDVACAVLDCPHNLMVSFALHQNLARHAVKPVSASFGSGKEHIGNGSSDRE